MNRIALTGSIIMSFLVTLLFVSPLMVEKNSINHLDGNANRIDYSEKWNSLFLLPRAIYYLGDIGCHQKYERSFIINGNQMPVCSRDVGIFIGMTIGFLLSLSIMPCKGFVSTAIQYFPIKIRERIKNKRIVVVMTGISLVAPLFLDWSLQYLTTYESNNLLRVLTGSLAGIAIACFIVISFTLPGD